jgi:hypothetical protein
MGAPPHQSLSAAEVTLTTASPLLLHHLHCLTQFGTVSPEVATLYLAFLEQLEVMAPEARHASISHHPHPHRHEAYRNLLHPPRRRISYVLPEKQKRQFQDGWVASMSQFILDQSFVDSFLTFGRNPTK